MWLHPNADTGKASTPECSLANLYQTSLPNAESHSPGGPPVAPRSLLDGSPVEALPWVLPSGPELRRGRGPHPGTPRGRSGRMPRVGGAGSPRRDPDPGARPGWEGRGRGGGGVCSKTLDRGGQGGVAVHVGLFLLLAFMIFFFHGSGKNNLIHPCPLWKNKPLSKATCRSVSTSGTHERKPVSKHLARVSVQ